MAKTPDRDTTWFETPERDQRLQLVAHLLRNAEQPVYLRGPAGSGKTRFCRRLLEMVGEEFSTVRLVGTADLDVRNAVGAQLRGVDAESSGRVLLLVDNADALASVAIDTLYDLHREGAQLLLCGRGEMLPRTGPVGLHLIDLPPLSPAQAGNFLAACDATFVAGLGERGLSELWEQTGGWPGRILDRLTGRDPPKRGAVVQTLGLGRSWQIGGAGVVLVLALVLWQQDRINAWFVSDARDEQPAVVDASDSGVLVLPPYPAPPAGVDEVPPSPAVAEPVIPPPEPPSLPEARAGVDDSVSSTETPEQAVGAAAIAPTVTDTVPPDAGVMPVEATPADAVAPVTVSPVPPGTSGSGDASGKDQTAEPVALPDPAPEAPRAEPETTKPTAKVEALPGALWLQAQPDGYYTLQLLGARDLIAIQRFANTHALQGDYAVVVRDLKGKPWYSLIYGSFSDRAEALGEKAKLGASLAKDAWPRRFGDLR